MTTLQVKCVLYDRDGNRVTDTVVEKECFLAGSDNPFPCSELISAICTSAGTDFLYRVAKAREAA